MVPSDTVPHIEQPPIIVRKVTKPRFDLAIQVQLFGRRDPVAEVIDAAANVLHDPCLVATEVRASRNPLKIEFNRSGNELVDGHIAVAKDATEIRITGCFTPIGCPAGRRGAKKRRMRWTIVDVMRSAA